jgi:hypothetical protein
LSGGSTQRRDGVYKEWGVVVELDGQLGHPGTGLVKDMWRDNAAAARGEVTLRYGWTDVAGQPSLAAKQLAEVLTSRGWTGRLTRCASC